MAVARAPARPLDRLAASVRGREVVTDWTVGEPLDAVYRYCRDACVLADLVTEIRRIERVDDRRMRVHLVGVNGVPLVVPVERTADRDQQLVAWRAGGHPGVGGVQLRLRPGPWPHTTRVHARMWWRPGRGLVRQFAGDPQRRLEDALHRMECALADRLADGEVAPLPPPVRSGRRR
ncbi:hypothetical protein [Streptoalloteichus hindustanus]|uniref:hypothetical protein n=1 Tax=Streptoalloteichus hindustanus TaxID=2017 RepID=UPI0011610212|nr:hypothetical protein [Streptoalloteichus hindustanus]